MLIQCNGRKNKNNMKTVTINKEQGVYVIPSGNGYTCLGFDVCITRAAKLAAELNELFSAKRGTMQAYNEYNRLLDVAKLKHIKTGWRSKSELIPEFIGNEGKRVEIIDKYEEKRRFYIGKSTGFIPCHLEILKSNSSGGGGITGYPFKQITFLNKYR